MGRSGRAVGSSRGAATSPDSRPAAGDAGALPDSVLWRVLLGTDATVVRLLEACFGEPVATAGLDQELGRALPGDAPLELSGVEEVLRRTSLLRGASSGRNYVHAESAIVPARLAPDVREGLLASAATIGSLLVAGRVESFRELLATGRTAAGERARWFGLGRGDRLVFRTYRIFYGGRPAMLITEHFPPTLFDAGAGAGAARG
jgi:chorismate-pyruvate lyase